MDIDIYIYETEDNQEKIIVISLLISIHEIGIGDEEIQRQNRITARIVANYLERRLFPFKRPTHRLPTVDEILPTTSSFSNQENTAESKNKITRDLDHGTKAGSSDRAIDDDDHSNDDDDENNEQIFDPNDPENLQSVESNHVDSYYPEMSEGRYQLFYTIAIFCPFCSHDKIIESCKQVQKTFFLCVLFNQLEVSNGLINLSGSDGPKIDWHRDKSVRLVKL